MIKSGNRYKCDLCLDFEEGRKAAQKMNKIIRSELALEIHNRGA